MGLKSEITQDVNKAEAIGRDFIKNYIALTIYDGTGVGNNISQMANPVTRNLARGFAFYLADEVEEDIMTGRSNLRDMSAKVLVDDTLFDTMKSVAVETLYEPVRGVISGSIPSGFDSDRIITSLIWTSSNLIGSQMGLNHPLKKLSSFVGWNE